MNSNSLHFKGAFAPVGDQDLMKMKHVYYVHLHVHFVHLVQSCTKLDKTKTSGERKQQIKGSNTKALIRPHCLWTNTNIDTPHPLHWNINSLLTWLSTRKLFWREKKLRAQGRDSEEKKLYS